MDNILTHHTILEDFLDSNLRKAVKMMPSKSIPQSMAVYHCNAVLSGGVQSHTDVTDVSFQNDLPLPYADHVGFGWKIWMFEVVWNIEESVWHPISSVCVLKRGQQAKTQKTTKESKCWLRTRLPDPVGMSWMSWLSWPFCMAGGWFTLTSRTSSPCWRVASD